ncbi:hypothetical protein C8Q80DRAFT_1135151 [Daedaleopsis nitida]|nr:hypothetical protein C8Q80DRAFT_1135151 [Daedaleopsis nitida]
MSPPGPGASSSNKPSIIAPPPRRYYPRRRDEAGSSLNSGYTIATATVNLANPDDRLNHPEVRLEPLVCREMKTWYRFYPILPLVYVGHAWLFRRAPRVFPRLTSLRLWELYASTGFYAALETERRRLASRWVDDRDFAIIELAAHLMWEKNHGDLADIQSMTFPSDMISRSDFYPRRTDGVLAELVWWNNHMWSTDQTWKGVAVCLLNAIERLQQQGRWDGPVNGHDWDATCTFIANAIHSHDGGSNGSVRDIFPYMAALASVTPVAMLARWLQWRNPVLWLNCAQRALFYGVAYFWPMRTFHFHWYSNSIQDKRKIADILCEANSGVSKYTDVLISMLRTQVHESVYKK